MTFSDFLRDIANRHSDCIAKSFQEKGCGLDLSWVNRDSLFCIHGTKYQRKDRNFGKLADRVIFSSIQGGFVCSLELKSGTIGNVRDVVEQIQGGLRLAERELPGIDVSHWFPLLLHGRSVHPIDRKELDAKRNRVYFRNEPKPIQLEQCGFRLSENLFS